MYFAVILTLNEVKEKDPCICFFCLSSPKGICFCFCSSFWRSQNLRIRLCRCLFLRRERGASAPRIMAYGMKGFNPGPFVARPSSSDRTHHPKFFTSCVASQSNSTRTSPPSARRNPLTASIAAAAAHAGCSSRTVPSPENPNPPRTAKHLSPR